MKLTINVTKEILQESRNCGLEMFKPATKNCAIAVALKYIFPDIAVSYDCARINDNFSLGNLKLPEEATNFIKEFDRLNPEERINMTPFSFDVEIPEKVVELIDIEEIKNLLVNSKTLALI